MIYSVTAQVVLDDTTLDYLETRAKAEGYDDAYALVRATVNRLVDTWTDAQAAAASGSGSGTRERPAEPARGGWDVDNFTSKIDGTLLYRDVHHQHPSGSVRANIIPGNHYQCPVCDAVLAAETIAGLPETHKGAV